MSLKGERPLATLPYAFVIFRRIVVHSGIGFLRFFGLWLQRYEKASDFPNLFEEIRAGVSKNVVQRYE
jgi:hypothetical protein